MQVEEGIHRLTQGVVNFYLIEEGGKLLLVDAGAPGDWELLVRAVAGLGRRLDDLEAVLLTHAHPDHIGTAERARTTAGAPVWVHHADADMATSGRRPKATARSAPTCCGPSSTGPRSRWCAGEAPGSSR